jgi:hypothetical protein
VLAENAIFDFAQMGMINRNTDLIRDSLQEGFGIRRAASSLPAVFVAIAFSAHARGDLVSMDAFHLGIESSKLCSHGWSPSRYIVSSRSARIGR